jgi:hypothetical protein
LAVDIEEMPTGPVGRSDVSVLREDEMVADAKTIRILGGGIGGQVGAGELRRTLPREHRITVVERELTHAFAPSFLWATGDRKPRQIFDTSASLGSCHSRRN